MVDLVLLNRIARRNMEHIAWLFRSPACSLAQIKEGVLAKEALLLHHPQRFDEELQRRVYPVLDGSNLLLLAYYFSLRDDCFKALEAVVPKQSLAAAGGVSPRARLLQLQAQRAVISTHMQVSLRL